MRHIIWVLWPAFIAAGMAEIVFFTVIDPQQLYFFGQPVALSPREYDLLGALLDANGAMVSRDDLLDRVWGEEWVGTPRTLDVHIRWLRGKIEADPAHPRLILTVRGAGYRLVTASELTSRG